MTGKIILDSPDKIFCLAGKKKKSKTLKKKKNLTEKVRATIQTQDLGKEPWKLENFKPLS